MLKLLRMQRLVVLDGQTVLKPMHVQRLAESHVEAKCLGKSSGAETRLRVAFGILYGKNHLGQVCSNTEKHLHA